MSQIFVFFTKLEKKYIAVFHLMKYNQTPPIIARNNTNQVTSTRPSFLYPKASFDCVCLTSQGALRSTLSLPTLSGSVPATTCVMKSGWVHLQKEPATTGKMFRDEWRVSDLCPTWIKSFKPASGVNWEFQTCVQDELRVSNLRAAKYVRAVFEVKTK